MGLYQAWHLECENCDNVEKVKGYENYPVYQFKADVLENRFRGWKVSNDSWNTDEYEAYCPECSGDED